MKLRKFVVSFLACSIALSLAVGLTGCGAQKQGPVKEGSIVVGASPSPHAQILEAVSEQLAQKGYQLEIKEFTDYIMPNTALEDGELDANFFQHQPYLTDFNEKNGTKLVSAAAIHFEPLGIYGGKNRRPCRFTGRRTDCSSKRHYQRSKSTLAASGTGHHRGR